MSAKLLKSPENPRGFRLSELLRKIRLEVEGEALRRERGPARAVALQVSGLLLTGEGLLDAADAQGHAFDCFPPPKLVPAPRR
jgi:hypothetical protein